MITANEHSLCCRSAGCWRGQEAGGISIALVAEHKRKDQLIDKILITAFDFNDRSVKVAAAASPSSSFPLFKLTRVSFDEPAPAFVSVSGFHLGFIDTSAKMIPDFGSQCFNVPF